MRRPKEILKEVQESEKRKGKQVMFYLDASLAHDFRAVCQRKKVTASRVVEALLREFMKEIGKSSHKRG